MPKEDIDYSNTIIYKIYCKDESVTDIYVGHTTNFIQRKYSHKICSNNSNKLKIYEVIRNNGGWENWSMIQIEEISCNNFNEACARERHWIETLKASLNKHIPNRTLKEWYQIHKEQIAEYKKQYREQNKEQMLQQKYLKQNCECGGKYMEQNKSRHLKTKKHQDYINQS
jgi:hypothetical protein